MMWESFCEKDTVAIAKELGEDAKPGGIFLLEGELGAGKTAFAKGFALGLGITEPITSPTFTILQEYPEGKIPFYHFDAYRILEPEEMYEIGWENYLFGNGVCLIEWASRVREILPDGCKTIRLEKDLEKGFDYRKITME